MPRAMATRQCQADHGRRSSRAGMSDCQAAMAGSLARGWHWHDYSHSGVGCLSAIRRRRHRQRERDSLPRGHPSFVGRCPSYCAGNAAVGRCHPRVIVEATVFIDSHHDQHALVRRALAVAGSRRRCARRRRPRGRSRDAEMRDVIAFLKTPTDGYRAPAAVMKTAAVTRQSHRFGGGQPLGGRRPLVQAAHRGQHRSAMRGDLRGRTFALFGFQDHQLPGDQGVEIDGVDFARGDA